MCALAVISNVSVKIGYKNRGATTLVVNCSKKKRAKEVEEEERLVIFSFEANHPHTQTQESDGRAWKVPMTFFFRPFNSKKKKEKGGTSLYKM